MTDDPDRPFTGFDIDATRVIRLDPDVSTLSWAIMRAAKEAVGEVRSCEPLLTEHMVTDGPMRLEVRVVQRWKPKPSPEPAEPTGSEEPTS